MNAWMQRATAALMWVLLMTTGGTAPAHAAGSGKPAVIFVHGFLGFCRDEALGYKYWGGFDDLVKQLDARYSDMQVFSVCVGPVSSNYDRAVELFWKIKGGCIDYGSKHAADNGHERYFKNSTQARNLSDSRQCPSTNAPEGKNRAVYKDWDSAHPVHIIAHSQGGQTARVLAQLLASNGASPEGDTHLFGPYATNATWIKSITTISTPNDGTTLSDAIVDYVPWVQSLVGGLALVIGGNPDLTDMVYDFKLDQWDIAQRGTAEDFPTYMHRVLHNSRHLFEDHTIRDVSTFDLSPDGALRENAWVTDLPNIYYFSWSTRATTTGFVSGWRYPRLDANPLISLFCGPGFMGTFSRNAPPAIDATWWDSDCVVPTRSHKAPTLQIPRAAALGTAATGRPVGIVDLRSGGTPQQGKWNWRGLVDTWDHFDITGWTLGWSSADKLAWYKNHVDLLRALP